MQELLAISELDTSTKKAAPQELSVEGLMLESAMDSVGVSSDKSEEAKQELQEYIAVMLEKEKDDAFEAVRYAIYKVVPQVMTYREAVLEETADQFNAVNDLNNGMLDMQGKFADAGDMTVLGHSNTAGVESAYAYFETAKANATKVQQMIDNGTLPNGIGNSILDNLDQIVNSTYDYPDTPDFDPSFHKHYQATGLFNGLVGTDMQAYSSTDPNNPDNSFYYVNNTPSAAEDPWKNDRTTAYYNDSTFAPYANGLNDNNTIIQSNLNGQSKLVEAEFKFLIEEYGQYLSLSSQLYNGGVKSVQVHVKGQ